MADAIRPAIMPSMADSTAKPEVADQNAHEAEVAAQKDIEANLSSATSTESKPDAVPADEEAPQVGVKLSAEFAAAREVDKVYVSVANAEKPVELSAQVVYLDPKVAENVLSSPAAEVVS